MPFSSLPVALLASVFVAGIAIAQSSPQDGEYFEKNVRPVLVQNCYQCHGPQSKTAFGNLRLTSRAALLKGGDSGPALDAGNPEQSLLVRAIRHGGPINMPPTGKMKPADVDALVHWVKMGAPWPEDPGASTNAAASRSKGVEERRKDHWAWQAVKRPQPPLVRNAEWARSPLDRFILAKLEEKGLNAAPPADPYTLIRRVYFTLTGLPPSPEEADAFAKDPSDAAFAATVDKLLASPHFGERWGRHWLDSTYFADTMDIGRRIPAKHAWRYRDYVIDSFNADKPFNRFVIEQLAGDLLPYTTSEQRRAQVIATGFLSLGPWTLVNADKGQLQMDVADLQIDMIGKSLLGLTLACARCHDHKFDPIPQKDYYGVAGILTSTQTLKGIMTDVFSDLNRVRLPETPGEASEFERETAKYEQQFRELKAREDSLDHRKQEKDAELAALRKTQPEGSKADEDRLTKEAGDLDSQLNELRSRIKLLEYVKPTLPEAFGVEDAEKPCDAHITIRGNAHMLGDTAPRGFVQIATLAPPPNIQKGSGRLELAEWIAAPSNPLTARVYVNRVWYHVFGEGIVRSVDNVGIRGEVPSHPELLDYLATNFVEQGWSLKKLVRAMVLSQTFRMASSPNKAAMEADPENRLLWRMNRKRLSGEEIRDAILQIDGQLDPGRAGPSLGLEIPGNLKPFEPTFVDEKLRLPENIKNRRTVYLPVLRKSQMDALDMLNLFGFPDANQINGQRAITNVPTQALYLMNSPFYQEQSRIMARLMEDRLGLYDRARVADLIWRVFNRRATDAEIRQGLDFVYEIERMLRKQPTPPANPMEEAWARYCQTLFASSEFLFKS